MPSATRTHCAQAKRPAGDGLKLVVMSATLEAASFVSYLPGCKPAMVYGRTYPVRLLYTAQPEDNYLDAALNATLQVRDWGLQRRARATEGGPLRVCVELYIWWRHLWQAGDAWLWVGRCTQAPLRARCVQCSAEPGCSRPGTAHRG